MTVLWKEDGSADGEQRGRSSSGLTTVNSSTHKFSEETDAVKTLGPKIAAGCQGNRRDDTQPWRWGRQDQEKKTEKKKSED